MKAKVLIAGSDSQLCDVYQKFLRECGFEADIAHDALDCIRKLQQRTPAAVVLDRQILWGGSDGVLCWLREERPLSQIPVIVTATGDKPNGGDQDEKPPVIKVLAKQSDLAGLLESVAAAVTASRQNRPLETTHKVGKKKRCIY